MPILDAHQRFSLPLTISTLVVGLLLLTLAAVVGIGLTLRAGSANEIARALQTSALTRVRERIEERFEPTEALLRSLVDDATAGRVDVADHDDLRATFLSRMRADPRVEWLAFLDPGTLGEVVTRGYEGMTFLVRLDRDPASGARRRADTTLFADGRESRTAPTRDTTTLADEVWYRLGCAADGPVWTERHLRTADGTYGRACALALRDDRGEVEGVFASGFGSDYLQTYLAETLVAKTGRVFLVDQNDGEIAVSPWPTDEQRFGPAIREALAGFEGGVAAVPSDRAVTSEHTHHGRTYVVALQTQEIHGKPVWVNAVAVPKHELVGFLDRYALPAIFALLGVTALGITLALWLAARVAHPLRRIAGDLERVAEYELTGDVMPASRITEVAIVSDSVNRMKSGLRSFGHYVPTDVVRHLLREGQEARLGGREQPLTLFFSDVAGFTAVSEGMRPSELVRSLGAYLDVVVAEILREEGTVDKFMGDGVLAFYNAPLPVEDHASRACRTALRVQHALALARAAWSERDWPSFQTRVGLHTGEVVVGNIGTTDRFAYTVIGDAVNLAARLESINKVYGTWILASQATREAAGDAFEWRRVDRTAVKGREGGGFVYELLGETRRVEASVLYARDVYERGLNLYLQRRFEDAVREFEEVARLVEDDPPSRVLAERARSYAATPPAANWNGVHVQTVK